MPALDETAIDQGRDAAGQPDAGEPGSTRASAYRLGRAPHRPPATHMMLMMLVRIVPLIALQFVMVSAYAWSAVSTAPRNVPVAITGPLRAVALVIGEVEGARPGAIKLLPAGTTAQARQDILTRQAYGAILVSGQGRADVLVASGGGPAVASVLAAMAAKLGGASAQHPANVTDIVPTAAADQTGLGFVYTVLPLMISSLAAGVALTLTVPRPSWRAVALTVFAIGGGLVSAAVAHTWLDIVPGNFAAIAGAMALAALAVAAGVSGLAELGARFGNRHVGLAAGALIIMTVGIPFSGMSSAAEMLPGAWGFFGQCLPAGATATLLRSVGYFDGARSGGAWAVLGIWAGAGLLLTLLTLTARRGRASSGPALPAPPPAVLTS
jgi:hypothetical protein